MHDQLIGKELTATHRIRVRYAETDQMGVVYHANYIVWFHEARDALFREAGITVETIESEGFRFPVVDASCRYLQSARYGDEVLVKVRLRYEKVARMQFHYEVRHARSQRLLATGSTLSVMTDLKGRVLLRMPEQLDSLVVAHLQRQLC